MVSSFESMIETLLSASLCYELVNSEIKLWEPLWEWKGTNEGFVLLSNWMGFVCECFADVFWLKYLDMDVLVLLVFVCVVSPSIL